MKKYTILIAILLCAVTLFAQAPEKFTYQAVVRNASNALMGNTQVGVLVNILQGSASGSAVYSESHVTTTNSNGLITVNIGGGNVLHGSFAGIDWSDGPYFLKTDIDPNGGNDYSITSTQQLLSVPYALYAKNAGNGFSGDYNDLTNRPEIPEIPDIPEVPGNVSAFANDANYVSNTACADVDLCTMAAALSQLQVLVQEQQQRIEDLEAQINTTDTTTTPNDTTTMQDGISCPGAPTVTDHEGNVYATVQIGNQCWMRENLRTTTSPSTGTYLIPSPDYTDTDSTYTGQWAYWYLYDSATYAPMKYGLLYNWYAAVDMFAPAYGETSMNTAPVVSVTFTGHRRGICPLGWHLPSDAEWYQLTDYVGAQSQYICNDYSSYIAMALAAQTGWNSSTATCTPGNEPSNNNATGFGALPAGLCILGTSSFNSGKSAFFWSATEASSDNAWNRYLHHNNASVGRSSLSKFDSYSVRCLKD